MKSDFFSKTIGVIGGIFLLFVAPMFFSCSDSSPSVSQILPSVVFDFKSADSVPEVYLSVFIATLSEARRAEAFTIRYTDETLPFEWRVVNPEILITNDKNHYVFAQKLSPLNSIIPQGDYQVIYSDAVGNEAEGSFKIEYNEKLLKSKVEDVFEIHKNLTENIALYDEFNQLFFMGKPKQNWKSDSDILNDQKRAAFKRKVLSTNQNRIVFLLPVEKLSKLPPA